MRKFNNLLLQWGRSPVFPVATFAALLTLTVLLVNDVPLWRGVADRVLTARGRINVRHSYAPGDTRVYYHFYVSEHGSQIRHTGADFAPPMHPKTRVTVYYAEANHKIHSLHLPLRTTLIRGITGITAFSLSIFSLMAAVPILRHFFAAICRTLRWLLPLLPVVAHEETRRAAGWAFKIWPGLGRVWPGGRLYVGVNPSESTLLRLPQMTGLGRVWPDWRQRMNTPFWMLRYPTGVIIFFTLITFTWGCRADWLYCLALPYAPVRSGVLIELCKLISLSLLFPIIVSSLWQWFFATHLRLSLWKTEIASAIFDAGTIFVLYWLCDTLDYWMI